MLSFALPFSDLGVLLLAESDGFDDVDKLDYPALDETLLTLV
ncbi:hypothetical protein [Marinomonas transparens]|nr:hypothetical protein [Marinomonas transparens]